MAGELRGKSYPEPPSIFASWLWASALAVAGIVAAQLVFGFSGPTWWGACFLIGVFAFQAVHAARWGLYERRERRYWHDQGFRRVPYRS